MIHSITVSQKFDTHCKGSLPEILVMCTVGSLVQHGLHILNIIPTRPSTVDIKISVSLIYLGTSYYAVGEARHNWMPS